MAKDTITLRLDGRVSVTNFKMAVGAFIDLLGVLTEEANQESDIEWIVADLEYGSAMIAALAIYETSDDGIAVEAVIDQFDHLGEDLKAGRLENYTPDVLKYANDLTSVINGHIPRLSIEAGKVWSIDRQLETTVQSKSRSKQGRTRTSLKGQIVALNQTRRLYFTLKEAVTGRIIRCYADRSFKSEMSKHWDLGSWVLVEGTFNEFTTIPTMTDITDIDSLGVGVRGGWREARGAAPRRPGRTTDSAVDAIRRLRDGD